MQRSIHTSAGGKSHKPDSESWVSLFQRSRRSRSSALAQRINTQSQTSRLCLSDTMASQKANLKQRRKKLKNSLKRLDIQENILEDSIFGLRPEQLSVEEFVILTQKISNETI